MGFMSLLRGCGNAGSRYRRSPKPTVRRASISARRWENFVSGGDSCGDMVTADSCRRRRSSDSMMPVRH
ncbi:hypothetical protein [Lysobacter gummosus]|uniref:hypothetical protein n=1 Tax=Lysobacter gummosus TaxID=262324 RepID=UPI0036390D80